MGESSPKSVGELGAKLHLDSGTLTPLLERIELAGMVERQRDAGDLRRVLVQLTQVGPALRGQASAVPATLAQGLNLPPDDVETLRSAVQGMVAVLCSRLDV